MMSDKTRILLVLLMILAGVSSACKPGEILGPSLTPSPTTTATPSTTPTSTATSTPTPSITPSPTVTPTPMGGSGQLYFTVYSDADNLGVFSFDLATDTLTRITEPGLWIVGVSPSGHKILLSQSEQLVTANRDGTGQTTIAEFNGQGAYWIPGTDRLLFVGSGQGQDFIYSIREDGQDLQQVTQSGMSILDLYNTHSQEYISWEQGYCTNAGCWSEGTWLANQDGTNQTRIDGINDPVFSPQGDRFIAEKFDDSAGMGQFLLHLFSLDLTDEKSLENPLAAQTSFSAGIFSGSSWYAWVSGGNQILVEWVLFDSASQQEQRHYYLYTRDGELKEEVLLEGLDRINYFYSISPDGRLIADVVFLEGEPLRSYARLIDLENLTIKPLEPSLPEGGTRMMWIYWLQR